MSDSVEIVPAFQGYTVVWHIGNQSGSQWAWTLIGARLAARKYRRLIKVNSGSPDGGTR